LKKKNASYYFHEMDFVSEKHQWPKNICSSAVLAARI